MIVNFSKVEVDQIREWGVQRNENTMKVRVRGHQIEMPKMGIQSNIEGVSGEFAAAKALHADWTPVREGPDTGIDIVLKDGTTCAVKFRRWINKPGMPVPFTPGKAVPKEAVAPRFATHTRTLKCDIGILTQEVPNSYGRAVEVVGWISKEEFNDPKVHHLYDFGWGLGEQPAVYDIQLHPIEVLQRMLA